VETIKVLKVKYYVDREKTKREGVNMVSKHTEVQKPSSRKKLLFQISNISLLIRNKGNKIERKKERK
jgi:ribosomal protein L24